MTDAAAGGRAGGGRGGQELKGNIRVYCRVRPVLPDEGAQETVDMAFAPGEDRATLTLSAPSPSALTGEPRGGGGGPVSARRREAVTHPFEFDQVLPPTRGRLRLGLRAAAR